MSDFFLPLNCKHLNIRNLNLCLDFKTFPTRQRLFAWTGNSGTSKNRPKFCVLNRNKGRWLVGLMFHSNLRYFLEARQAPDSIWESRRRTGQRASNFKRIRRINTELACRRSSFSRDLKHKRSNSGKRIPTAKRRGQTPSIKQREAGGKHIRERYNNQRDDNRIKSFKGICPATRILRERLGKAKTPSREPKDESGVREIKNCFEIQEASL